MKIRLKLAHLLIADLRHILTHAKKRNIRYRVRVIEPSNNNPTPPKGAA